jgi:hypothetical protein
MGLAMKLHTLLDTNLMAENKENLTFINKKKLNFRELAFLSEYFLHFNATRACLKIYQVTYGSARSYGCQLLKKPRIQVAMQQIISKNQIDAGFIKLKLLEEIEAPTNTAADRMVKLRAIETVARLMGYLRPRKGIESSPSGLDAIWDIINKGTKDAPNE